MTTDSVREDFEKEFAPSNNQVHWDEEQQCYVTDILVWRDAQCEYLAMWKAWQKAWQAAKERYEPRWISVEDRLPSGSELLIIAETDDYPHLGTVRTPARYNTVGQWFDIDCVDRDGDENQLYAVVRWMEVEQPRPATPNGGNGE